MIKIIVIIKTVVACVIRRVDVNHFAANFIWNHRKSSQNDVDVSLSHNYTLTFAKNRQTFKLNPLEIDTNIYRFRPKIVPA
jgi:adenine specific DNA methylase Mod